MVGAALVFSGCGGVLGTSLSPTLTAVAPINCAVSKAVAEDSNYSQAVSDIANGFSFGGVAADDLTKPANRIRVFGQRQRELKRQDAALAALAPADAVDRQYAAAARADLRDAEALVAYDLKYRPGDPKAPAGGNVPTALDDLAASGSPDLKKLFRKCAFPPDLTRRTQAYQG